MQDLIIDEDDLADLKELNMVDLGLYVKEMPDTPENDSPVHRAPVIFELAEDKIL